MDKVAALKALLSSTEVALLGNEDFICSLAFIPFHGASEPVLIIEQSELVCWLRMDGGSAVWRYGSMLTGCTSMPRVLANPLKDEGRAVSKAVNDAWSEIMSEWPPVGTDGEPERFVVSIEAGTTPAEWSKATESGPQVAAEAAPPTPTAAKGVQSFNPPSSDSPYATDFNPYRHDKSRYPAAPGYSEKQLDGRVLETLHPAVVPASIGAVAMFMAILPMPDEFYVLLRWAVPAMAIWIWTVASGHKKTGWVVVFALVAVLWNPLVPIEMPRGAWVYLNIAGLVLFAKAGVQLKASKPALRTDHTSSL